VTSAARSLPSGALPKEAAGVRSFDALYARQFDFMWRSLRRLGVPPSQVEDAAQDAFVVVHRKLADLRPDASEKAWLFGIALRVASDYRRTLRRKGTVSFDPELAPSRDTSPFDGTAKAQEARLLEDFLNGLDDDKRAVFVLAELEGASAPEVSEALGCNVNTVYSRLRLARERFVSFLAENGGEGKDHG
jgi:RNA polymerase sigma-70 factor (ECF subfamily)